MLTPVPAAAGIGSVVSRSSGADSRATSGRPWRHQRGARARRSVHSQRCLRPTTGRRGRPDQPRCPPPRSARASCEFFAERGHTVVPSASLVPAGDQTLLFTNSGMVQFKDVFRGVEKRSYTRAVDVQRCLRVAGKHNDFEEVGRTPRHHTLFEMLGNWSFGDYFKREAIHWAWEFLTRDMGIPAERLAATTYTDDEEAWAIWRDEIGLPPERMARWGDVDAGDDKNFWRMADTGPCGPCSEIHYDRGAHLSEGPDCVPDHSEHCPRWLEIWNLVFMEFDQRPEGRVAAAVQERRHGHGPGAARLGASRASPPTTTRTCSRPSTRGCASCSATTPTRSSRSASATRSSPTTRGPSRSSSRTACCPSNEGRGYVLRRIVRRAVRHGRLLGRREPFLVQTASVVIETMGDAYPILRERARRSWAPSCGRRPRSPGPSTRAPSTSRRRSSRSPAPSGSSDVSPTPCPTTRPCCPGDVAFRLHDTYGFPIDLTVELAAEYGVRVDRAGFEAALEEQRAPVALGPQGRPVAPGRADGAVRRHRPVDRRHPLPGLRDDDAPRPGSWPSCATRPATRSSRPGPRSSCASRRARPPSWCSTRPRSTPSAAARSVTRVRSATPPRTSCCSRSRTPSDRWAASSCIGARSTGASRSGQAVRAVVDADRRARTMRNHTATHLLHRAIRNAVGPGARQAGSLVAPGYLRFDFPFDRALTDAERQPGRRTRSGASCARTCRSRPRS